MKLRIATFNFENLDDKAGEFPTLDQRIAVLRPQLFRLRADIICFQEIHGQETTGQPRDVLALKKLFQNTPYATFNIACTKTSGNQVFDERNLVVVSRLPVLSAQQYNNTLVPAPKYQTVTALPASANTVKEIKWERPIFHVPLDLGGGKKMHLINLHLKSRLPVDVEGQKLNQYSWKTGAG